MYLSIRLQFFQTTWDYITESMVLNFAQTYLQWSITIVAPEKLIYRLYSEPITWHVFKHLNFWISLWEIVFQLLCMLLILKERLFNTNQTFCQNFIWYFGDFLRQKQRTHDCIEHSGIFGDVLLGGLRGLHVWYIALHVHLAVLNHAKLGKDTCVWHGLFDLETSANETEGSKVKDKEFWKHLI